MRLDTDEDDFRRISCRDSPSTAYRTIDKGGGAEIDVENEWSESKRRFFPWLFRNTRPSRIDNFVTDHCALFLIEATCGGEFARRIFFLRQPFFSLGRCDEKSR